MIHTKICTSYFYQIRFFPTTVVPISTAKWAPKWYGKSPYLDKRGVLCGYSLSAFAPGAGCEGLCHGREGCSLSPPSCPFLTAYRDQLDQLDYALLMSKLGQLEKKIQLFLGTSEEITFALMVHEAPTNPCSERAPIQQWFASHGHPIVEWLK